MALAKDRLPLRDAYRFGTENGLEKEIAKIRHMRIDLPASWGKKTNTVRRGYVIDSFEAKGIFSRFKEVYWHPDEVDSQRERYLQVKGEYEGLIDEPDDEADGEASFDSENNGQQFALEAHLRDFLVKNLERIEPGLRLYQNAERNGREFLIDRGFIDILAVDRDDRFVVLELKLSRGREKALGQLLYYMAWVDDNLGHAPCRGIIVANEIPNALVLAVRRAQGITLCKYQLSFSIERTPCLVES